MLKTAIVGMILMAPTLLVLQYPISTHAQHSTVIDQNAPRMRLVAGEIDGRFTGAIMFPHDSEGDQAIVRVFYWQKMKGMKQDLLRTSTSVIPMLPGTSVLFDDVPAPIGKIRNIEVTLVHSMHSQSLTVAHAERFNRLH